MKKKVFAIVLSVLMLLSALPLSMAATLGDVDSNGKVDATDARTALRAAVGLDKLNAAELALADVDFDGDVDSTDARLILRAAVGLEQLHSHSYTSAVTTAATCENKGVKTFTCSCGDSYTEEIPATGHKAVTDKAAAATCTAAGKTEGTHCSVCNKVLKAQEVIPAKGHKAVTDKGTAATCTAAGKTDGTHCSVCNAVIKAQEVIPAKGHTAVTDKGTAATCTTEGKTDGSHCSVCNAVIKAQETIPVKEHTAVADKAVAATCTTEGKTEGSHCSVCNKVIVAQKPVASLGHKAVLQAAVPATCTEPGKTDGSYCLVCDTVIKAQQTIPAKGHTEEADKGYAATCTGKGMTDGSHCSVCYITLVPQTEIPAKGHTEVSGTAVPPTCTAPGSTAIVTCSVCKEELVHASTVPATGHVSSSLDESTVVEKNCTVNGYTGDYKCDVCGAVTAEGSVIAPEEGAHIYEKVVVEASCTADEYTVYKCIYCGYIDSENITESGKHPNGIGHTFGAMTTVNPTCDEGGYDTQTCSVCTYEERTNPKEATGHDYKKDNKESVTATCLEAGVRVSYCTVCNDKKTEDLGFAPCDLETVKVAGASYAQGDSCKTVERCKVCNDVVAETENYGAHKYMTATGPATEAKCETAGTQTLRCDDCGYEYTAIVQDALGHSNTTAKPATCTDPGYIISSGVCTREGCGMDLGAGTRIDIPAKGHKESGIQTCTTDVVCLTCGEVTQPHFGHDFDINSSAYVSYGNNNTVSTFFCTRCGEACTDKLATFEAVANKIKTSSYNDYYSYLHRISKTSAENKSENINFGIWTSTVKDMFEEEMAVTPVTYSWSKTAMVKWSLPAGENYVFADLEKADIDSISVERISGLEFSKVFEGFDDKITYGKNEYDLTKYKAKEIDENVIKVTVDVKNEKYYGGINELPVAEKTSLQKILGIDVREELFGLDHSKDCPASCSATHFLENSDHKLYMQTSEQGMTMNMTLDDLTTDGKVTYYFLEETYEPIIAVYEATESMKQHMDMNISIGLTIKGSMDTITKTNTKDIYVFHGYQPAA